MRLVIAALQHDGAAIQDRHLARTGGNAEERLVGARPRLGIIDKFEFDPRRLVIEREARRVVGVRRIAAGQVADAGGQLERLACAGGGSSGWSRRA
jgi:hypothetical protein